MAASLVTKGPEAEILRRIGEKGPITFAEFMAIALYWHDGGYYHSSMKKWGEGGDYITNIDVSPAFARSLAEAVREMWELLGRPGTFTLVEAGAGRGYLSKGVMAALKDLCPGLYSGISLQLVEKNPFLREPPSDKAIWHEDISEIRPFNKGVVLSNELVDSLPVHRVVEDGGELKEVYTDFDGDYFVEVPGPLSTDAILSRLKEEGVVLARGQRAEVNLEAGEWITKAAGLFDSGFVVTIDYGLPARELYSPERMEGTLMCHYRHTLNDNPYINIGSQDITAHVDFTNLFLRGRKAGLSLTGFTTQKNFLLGLGILEELQEAEGAMEAGDYERINRNRALAELIMPGGMGDTFKVLVQHRGFKERPKLKGFSFKDMSYCLHA